MARVQKEISRDENLKCITINLVTKDQDEFYAITQQLNHDDLEISGCPDNEDGYYLDQIAFFKKENGDTWKEVEEEANDFYKYVKNFVKQYNKVN